MNTERNRPKKRLADYQDERRNLPSRGDLTGQEERRGFLERRVKAFEDRSRKAGDGTTWAVVLGAFIGVALLMSYSIGRETSWILLPLGVFIAWFIVVSSMGKVNITSILWGSATSDQRTPPNGFWIFQPTALLAGFAMASILRNAITGYTYGWAGLILLAACLAYFVIYLRVGILKSS